MAGQNGTYKATMIAKFGSEEAWKEYQRELGSAGGKAKVPKGFALMSRKEHIRVSKKGGSVIRRKKNSEQV